MLFLCPVLRTLAVTLVSDFLFLMSKGKSVICQTAHDNKALIWALLDHALTCFEELGLFSKLQLYQEDITDSKALFVFQIILITVTRSHSTFISD